MEEEYNFKLGDIVTITNRGRIYPYALIKDLRKLILKIQPNNIRYVSTNHLKFLYEKLLDDTDLVWKIKYFNQDSHHTIIIVSNKRHIIRIGQGGIELKNKKKHY